MTVDTIIKILKIYFENKKMLYKKNL